MTIGPKFPETHRKASPAGRRSGDARGENAAKIQPDQPGETFPHFIPLC